jgi:hypothetical protein
MTNRPLDLAVIITTSDEPAMNPDRGYSPKCVELEFSEIAFPAGRFHPGFIAAYYSRGCYELDEKRLRNAGNGDREGTEPTVESAFLCDFRPSP